MDAQKLIGLTEFGYRVRELMVNADQIEDIIPRTTGKADTAVVRSVEGHAGISVIVVWV